jgi:hypothetical protein
MKMTPFRVKEEMLHQEIAAIITEIERDAKL